MSDGQARVRLEHDGSPAATYAAQLLREQVVLRTAVALPARGSAPALRIETGAEVGYRVTLDGDSALITGDDPARAVYDLLDEWGEEPRETLALEARRVIPERTLWIEAERFDASVPARGFVVRGLDLYDAQDVRPVRELGYGVRVVSETFDDFLDPTLFDAHPDWFALRQGERAPRGNFALTNPEAREAYLAALGVWLADHPEVHSIEIWPEVTIAWDEDSIALGEPEAYALLWREAAARFPGRGIGILATGATLRPPAGNVPGSVSVRLRAGRDASGLQGLAGQPIEAIVRAWEARGARVVLEIDAQPASWCGMPWPVEPALRENARRFREAVLVDGTARDARVWRDPARVPERGGAWGELERRARSVASWGDPADAEALFADPLPDMPDEKERWRIAAAIGSVERLRAVAAAEERATDTRREAATEAWLTWRTLQERMPPDNAAVLRRYRERALRGAVESLFPEGLVETVGPARVRDAFDRMEIETDRLRLGIDRATGAIDRLALRLADGWSDELAGDGGRLFRVASPGTEAVPIGDSLRVVSPGAGELAIELAGTFGRGGPRWETRLLLTSASGRVRQFARVEAAGGAACACHFPARPFDRWLCPPYAAEGPLDGAGGQRALLPLPAGALIYVRDGEHGVGLALRLPGGGRATLLDGEATTLLAATRGDRLEVEWTLFTAESELAR